MIRCLQNSNFRLLQTDKGGFVTAHGDFCKKGIDAVNNNFHQVTNAASHIRMKIAVIKMYETLERSLQVSTVVQRGSVWLFFSWKTDKPEWVFCAIVYSRGTWERRLGRHLERALSLPPVEDSFLIESVCYCGGWLWWRGSISVFSWCEGFVIFSAPKMSVRCFWRLHWRTRRGVFSRECRAQFGDFCSELLHA